MIEIIQHRFKDLLLRAREKLVVENIDPLRRNLITILFPQMGHEHIARYTMVGGLLKELGFTGQTLTVVDLATGQGYGAEILKKTIPGAKVMGFEIKSESLTKAKKAYGQEGIYYIQANVTRLPVASASSDVVTGFEILEHLDERGQEVLAREIQRILKPGGYLFLSVPYPRFVEVSGRKKLGASHNPFHLYEPTREEVLSLLEGAGLKTIREYGQAFVPREQVEDVKKVAQYVPIWPIYTEVIPRDFSVTPYPEGQKVPLTQIFVAQKVE